MVFESDGVQTPTFDRRLSLHAVNHVQIHYLFAGDTSASMERLATTFVRVDAKGIGGGEVFFRYRPCTHEKCVRCPRIYRALVASAMRFGLEMPQKLAYAGSWGHAKMWYNFCITVFSA